MGGEQERGGLAGKNGGGGAVPSCVTKARFRDRVLKGKSSSKIFVNGAKDFATKDLQRKTEDFVLNPELRLEGNPRGFLPVRVYLRFYVRSARNHRAFTLSPSGSSELLDQKTQPRYFTEKGDRTERFPRATDRQH